MFRGDITMKKVVHVVGAVIENDKKEIFCAQRGPKMSLANLWEFPGGKIEIGETKESALIREIQEEFNCEISVSTLVEDTTYDYGDFIVRLETFSAKLVRGEPILSEHSDSKWLSKEKLHLLNWAPADIPAVKTIQLERD